MKNTGHCVKRREFLKTGAAAAGTLAVGTYLPRAWAAEPLRVSAYGGYFEDSLAEYVYPEFSKASGIEIESVSQPGSTGWFTNIDTAVRAGGAPPTDVTMTGGQGPLRFPHVFQPLDESRLRHLSNVPDYLVTRDDGGVPIAVAAVAWYMIFVTNTEVYPEAPESWRDLWLPKYEDSLGIPSEPDASYMLDIIAHSWFDGSEMLAERDGLMTALEKLAELKPNVKLWYRDEGQFQSQLQQGETPAGMYYHDVTLLAIADGFPLRSTFPKEGGGIDFGSWGLTTGSTQGDAAHVFIDYCCQGQVQADISRAMGVAPVVDRTHMDLSDEEFSAVSSDIPPIVPFYSTYVKNGDWINETWANMLSG